MPPGLAEWADADWSPFSSRFSSSNGPSPPYPPGRPGPNKALDHAREVSARTHELALRTAGDDMPGYSPAQACGT
eukprot:scaffold72167_cov21-Phaeocystis_antarctica.AAC.1